MLFPRHWKIISAGKSITIIKGVKSLFFTTFDVHVPNFLLFCISHNPPPTTHNFFSVPFVLFCGKKNINLISDFLNFLLSVLYFIFFWPILSLFKNRFTFVKFCRKPVKIVHFDKIIFRPFRKSTKNERFSGIFDHF